MADHSPPDIPDGLEQLLPQFIAEMERDAACLPELAAGDPAILAEHAHAARGKAAMFGEQCLFSLFSEVERLAFGGDQRGLDALIAQVLERVRQLQVYGAIAVQGPP